MNMNKRAWIGVVTAAGAVALLSGCGMMGGMMDGGAQQVTLSGANEVPPVMTSATGTGTVRVSGDGAVSVNIKVSGMSATAAHIHEAAAGANGPVIVPLTKQGDDTFVSAAGAKFTDSQLAAYKAGRTYINVHSAKNPPGEIRAQLRGN
jgi:hypothetical protein